ncbi:MAG: L,D-transpeptidase [Cytophagaceae bacterium]|nr:L,D-transpeptidase [Gemmatimonadaceae bacterium]
MRFPWTFRTSGLMAALLALAPSARAQDVRAVDSAASHEALTVIVSLDERRLWAVQGTDTLRTATVSVGSGSMFSFGGRQWRFATPRGQLRVKAKKSAPIWVPPDWHYAEAARDHGLELRPLPPGGFRLTDGRVLEVRDSVAGIVELDGRYEVLPTDEHIVFEGTLFIPPIGTRNRQLHGELGDFALDLGDGYLLHGTSNQGSIGTATTHGCIRLSDEDLAWLFERARVGTRVVISR